MNGQPASYTTEEIAELLKVSKLTVYDLIKKGELRAYRVGRQMRVDAPDLEAYKEKSKSGGKPTIQMDSSHTSEGRSSTELFSTSTPPVVHHPHNEARKLIISGQDISLDLLSNALGKHQTNYRPLRSYTGSLNGLIAMYEGEADIVSTHLFDGDTETYNLPYIKRLLVGHSYLVVNLLSRAAGLFVQKNNPKNIYTWRDLDRRSIKIVNREIGSGARVLLDEKLRLEGISPPTVNGYREEELNHIAVASKVAAGSADVGVGNERAAALVGVDFIPLIKERYDLVILKTDDNEVLRSTILTILQSKEFKDEVGAMSGYDLSQTGTILFETH